MTIIEFSDFPCPFCKRVLPTLTQLETQYGEKVKVVFRDFPLDRLHPQASKAHEAARCADEQGQFWAYHDRLYANAPKASPEQLTAYTRRSSSTLQPSSSASAVGATRPQRSRTSRRAPAPE